MGRRSIYIVMIFDLHNDLLTVGFGGKKIAELAAGYCDALRGVVLVFWSTRSISLPEKNVLPSNEKLLFAVEDLHFFRPDREAELLKFSPVYCGLTWNYDNSLAGGALGESGITDLGKYTVEFLNRNGISVDTAHLNEKSFFDVSELAERIINSHTFISDIHPHPRNISFNQAEKIVSAGGLVGLTPVNAFTGGGLDSYMRGMDGFLQRFGDGNLCIGTDFNGSDDFPEQLKDYGGFAAVRERLVELGYTEKTIKKIFYKNAVDFFRRQEKANERLI